MDGRENCLPCHGDFIQLLRGKATPNDDYELIQAQSLATTQRVQDSADYFFFFVLSTTSTH